MTLEETAAYLNRVTDFDWEYIGPALKSWEFRVHKGDRSIVVFLSANGWKPGDKGMRNAIKSVIQYFESFK